MRFVQLSRTGSPSSTVSIWLRKWPSPTSPLMRPTRCCAPSLIETGEVSLTRRTWDRKPLSMLHIPRSIQDAVQQRSNQLSESARQLLVLAAVSGRRFDFAVLQQVRHHDEQQLLTLMKEFIGAQLVVEESAEQFAFRHAMMQQAVYTQLLVRERRVLHRMIGE